MPKLSISQAWDETRAILARDGKLLVSVALALIVLPQTILGVAGIPRADEKSLVASFSMMLVVLIGLAAQVALNRLSIGPAITVAGAIGRGFRRLGPLVVALILIGLALLVALTLIAFTLGALRLITIPAPGQPPTPALIAVLVLCLVLASAAFQLVLPVAAAEAGGPIKLLSRSWALARENYLRLLAFVAVIFLAALVVVLAAQAVIGSAVVVTLGKPVAGSISALVFAFLTALIQSIFTIVASVMLARIYTQLAGGREAQASVPSSGI
jgi:hypothetical protein